MRGYEIFQLKSFVDLGHFAYMQIGFRRTFLWIFRNEILSWANKERANIFMGNFLHFSPKYTQFSWIWTVCLWIAWKFCTLINSNGRIKWLGGAARMRFSPNFSQQLTNECGQIGKKWAELWKWIRICCSPVFNSASHRMLDTPNNNSTIKVLCDKFMVNFVFVLIFVGCFFIYRD